MCILINGRVCFLLIVFLLFLSCSKSEPNLQVYPSNDLVLNDVKLGRDVQINLLIKNHGYKELKINNVTASCKCVVVQFPKYGIKYNQEANVNLVFKAEELGYHEEDIVIISNAPDTYKIQTIKVNVVE